MNATNENNRRHSTSIVCGITGGACALLLTGLGFFAVEFFLPEWYKRFLATVALPDNRALTTNAMYLTLFWSRILPMICLLIGVDMLLLVGIVKRWNQKSKSP